MFEMHLPAIEVPIDSADALGRYRARLRSGLRIPSAISQFLVAYMAWPKDEDERNRWMAATIARRRAQGAKLPLDPAISPFGGLELVTAEALNAVAGRLTDQMQSWPPAADVLQMLVDLSAPDLNLPGGPSISKALELCADDSTGFSQTQTRRCWTRFGDVAHLLAAGALIASQVPEGGGSILSAVWFAPDSLLAIAAGYQIFGLDFKPHGQSKSLLPETLWRIPFTLHP